MEPTINLGRGICANTAYPGMDPDHDVPVLDDGDICLTRWRLSFKERLEILFGGSIWLCMKGRQRPVWLQSNVSRVFIKE